MSYNESKKQIEKIARKYTCKGDIIMRTALQYIVEYGQYMFKDEEFIVDQLQQIEDRHMVAEKEGKILFVSKDFELAIFECAQELAEINTYDLIIYMQKEMYWSNEGGMDYNRAMSLLERCMCWMDEQEDNNKMLYEVFSECGFEDDEIDQLGFGFVFE